MLRSRSTRRKVFLLAMSTVLFCSLGAQNAYAATHQLRNLYDGRCLDADISHGDYNGMKVQLWDCNGRSNQQWIYNSDGPIRSARNGKCLDADISRGDYNGVPLQLWTCNGRINQTWYLGRFTKREILSPWDHRCADADISRGDHNGMKVQLWTCNGRSNQAWTGLY